jgi:hypothetical protein
MRANRVNVGRRRAGVAKEPLYDLGHEPPLDPRIAEFAVRRDATNSAPFFFCRIASQASTAATAHGPCSSRGTATNCPAPP